MVHARWVSSVASVFALGGCTLLLGYGDEVRVSRDGGASDAPAGSSDAPLSEGGAPDNRPFCERQSPRPTFCASFDGAGFLSEWNESVAKNARLERDTSSFVSGPASLRISLDRQDDGNVEAMLAAAFPAWADKPISVAIGFDIQIEAAAPTNAFAVFASPIAMAAPDRAAYLLQLTGRPLADGSTIAVSLVEVTNSPDASREHASSVSLQIGKWAHVDLNVALGTANNSARLALDGAVGYEGALDLEAPGTPNITLGLATVTPDTTAWTYRLDNVTLDFR